MCQRLDSIDESLKKIATALESIAAKEATKGVPANVNVQERYAAAINDLKSKYQNSLMGML
jgi:hypothetical protein